MNWTPTAPISHRQAFPSGSPRPSRGTSRSLLLPLRVSRRRVATRPKAISSPLPRTCLNQPSDRSLNTKSLAHWRFDPVGDSGFHSARFTGHGSRLTNCALPAFNLFFFYLLRTLAAQWTPATPFSFKRFRTLSIAMGVYTPLPRALFAKGHSPLRARCSPVALQQKRFYPLFVYAVTDPFFHNEGGTPLPQNRRPNETPFHPPR
jgi:hypothetical protein